MKRIVNALLLLAIPLVLWADFYLAWQFGDWTRTLGANDEGAFVSGFWAFVVLVGAQVGAYFAGRKS